MSVFDVTTKELCSTIGMTLSELQHFVVERGFGLRVWCDDSLSVVQASTAPYDYIDCLEFFFDEDEGVVADFNRQIWD